MARDLCLSGDQREKGSLCLSNLGEVQSALEREEEVSDLPMLHHLSSLAA